MSGQVFIFLGFVGLVETDIIISIPLLCFKNKEGFWAREETSALLLLLKGRQGDRLCLPSCLYPLGGGTVLWSSGLLSIIPDSYASSTLSVSSLFTTAVPLVSLALLDSWKLGLQIVVKDARSDVRTGDSSDDLSRQFMNKIAFRFFWSEALHLWGWGSLVAGSSTWGARGLGMSWLLLLISQFI